MNRKNNNPSKSRIGQLQEEFKMSDSEIDEIHLFISLLEKDMTILEASEKLIESKSLNDRQKVAFSHILGIFRAEGKSLNWNSLISLSSNSSIQFSISSLLICILYINLCENWKSMSTLLHSFRIVSV